MAQLSLTWEPLWVSEIPFRVYCLLDQDWVAFTRIGVNADPISLDLVVCQVLVPIVDVTEITSAEVSVHQVMFSFLVTWLVRHRLRRLVTWWVRPSLVMWPFHGHVPPKFWSHGSWHCPLACGTSGFCRLVTYTTSRTQGKVQSCLLTQTAVTKDITEVGSIAHSALDWLAWSCCAVCWPLTCVWASDSFLETFNSHTPSRTPPNSHHLISLLLATPVQSRLMDNTSRCVGWTDFKNMFNSHTPSHSLPSLIVVVTGQWPAFSDGNPFSFSDACYWLDWSVPNKPSWLLYLIMWTFLWQLDHDGVSHCLLHLCVKGNPWVYFLYPYPHLSKPLPSVRVRVLMDRGKGKQRVSRVLNPWNPPHVYS